MSFLSFTGGALWVRATAPSGEPAAADLVPNVSEFTIEIAKTSEEKGPYLGNSALLKLDTKIEVTGNVSIDLPAAHSATIHLLRQNANQLNQLLWMRYRNGAGGSTEPGTITYTFTDVRVTNYNETASSDGISAEVSYSAILSTMTPSAS